MLLRPFLLALGVAGFAAQPSLPTLPDHPACLVGPSAVRTYAGGSFFHLKGQTTLAGLPQAMEQMVPALMRALAEARISTFGPLHVVYYGAGPEPGKAFDMEVGMLVPSATPAAGGAQVRVLAPFTCAATVLAGPVAQIGKAYEFLFPALKTSGKTPAAETRQMLLYWENALSPNNLILVQIGVRE